MREFKNSVLVKKDIIAPQCYEMLFNYLQKVTLDTDLFHSHLKDKIKGYYASGNPILLRAGEKSDKCWFVTEGFVVAYYYDHKKRCCAYMIFVAGEVAMIPEAFITKDASEVYLMATPDTHLLEITAEEMDEIYTLFPETQELAKLIIAYQSGKYIQRDKVLRYKGIERIKQFYKTFPIVVGPNKKANFIQKIISSYLHLAVPSLSSLLKQIKDEEGEEMNKATKPIALKYLL